MQFQGIANWHKNDFPDRNTLIEQSLTLIERSARSDSWPHTLVTEYLTTITAILIYRLLQFHSIVHIGYKIFLKFLIAKVKKVLKFSFKVQNNKNN